MNPYQQGYFDGYYAGELAHPPKIEDPLKLRQYWYGYEQGKIDYQVGREPRETHENS